MPPLLSVSASEGINTLRDNPPLLTKLQANIRAARTLLDQVDCISIPSHRASPIIHLYLRNTTTIENHLHPSSAASVPSGKSSNPTSPIPRDAPIFDIEKEERLLQEVVEDAMAQGVMITKAKRVRGLEITEARPSIRLAMTSALSKTDTEKAVNVLIKILKKKCK